MAEQTDIVELVKGKNPIEDVIEADGYPLEKRGGRYRKSSRPDASSLVVDIQNQAFFWNSRGTRGDVIAWVQAEKRCDFKGAVEILCQRAGLPAPNWGNADPQARMAARMREEALDVAARVFTRWLGKSPTAQAYVIGRGWPLWIGEGENRVAGTAIEAGLGYSGEGTDAEWNEMRAALREAGVDLESPAAVAILGYRGDVARWAHQHGVEHPHEEWVQKNKIPSPLSWKMIVYPHVKNGRVQYLSMRAIERKWHYNLPRELVGDRQVYLNHRYANRSDYVVLVEGQADAVTLGQWEMEAIALAGVKPSADLAGQLQGHETRYVGLDADKAGKNSQWATADSVGPLTRILDWHASRKTLLVRDGDHPRPAADADELVHALISGTAKTHDGDLPKNIVEILATLPVMKDARGFDKPAFRDSQGRMEPVATATDLLRAIEQLPDADAQKAGREKLVGELLDWSPSWINSQGEVTPVKDANDLLRAFLQARLEKDAQLIHVHELLDNALTYVETICQAAGSAEGAAKDKAQREALKVVAKLNEIDEGLPFSQYRTRLAKALGMQVREMQDALKKLKAKEDREQSVGEPIYTWGGVHDGWLIEYLYDVERDHASLAWRDPEGRVDSGENVIINGRLYKPYPQNDTLKSGAIQFPSSLGDKKNIRELIAYIEMYLKNIYLLPSDQVARLISYWVLLTWIYDAFETTVYLRAMGGAGSGKSELVKRIGLVCYRTMTANGAGSPASLFRAVERYKGAVILDEADLQQSDTEADMIKFYNLGAMRGNPIWRTVEVTGPNGEKDWEERAFQTFCPKLIAMRKDFRDDAVGSRSLTFKLSPREMIELKAAGIPLTINQVIKQRAQALRNLLLRWRLETWRPEIEVDMDWYEMSISARLNQVAGPLLAISKDDPEQQEDIRRTLREYYAETIITQSMTLTARVLEAIWKIWKYPDLRAEMVKTEPDGELSIKIGSITKICNELINEMNGEEDGDDDTNRKAQRELKPHRIGKIIREDMQMRVLGPRRDGFWMVWNEPRILGLSMKFGVNPDDFGPQNGNGSGNNGAGRAAQSSETPAAKGPDKAVQGTLA